MQKKIKLSPQEAQFTALLKELKVAPLHTLDGKKFHSRAAAGINDRLNWLVLQGGITKAYSQSAAEALMLRAATKWFKYPFIGWSTLW